jgi:hypothetical protein
MTPTITPAAPTVTYTAHLSNEEQGLELVVRAERHAGVCGPFVTHTFPDDTALATVEAFLDRFGLFLDGGWSTGRNYAGLILTAQLLHS